jgi:TetR/AcrR family transcriptional regulator, regulator of cefoperazone and chloramphenicol sensitivity
MNQSIVKESVFDRLLQVAVEVFAEFGFRDATVREICSRANVNLASVNYYFRNKESLYVHALAFAFQEANRLYPQDKALETDLEPEQRLTWFISNFLQKMLDDSHLGLHSKMIAREIADPTNALAEIIEKAIVPQFNLLSDIIRQILGDRTDKAIINRCLLSIFGQCLMFKHSRSIIDRMYPELIEDEKAIQACAEHIAKFSIAALTWFSRQQEKQKL